MLSFDEARVRVLQLVPRLGAEPVPLEDAGGRVLAEDVTATAPLPPHDYSAMDGYAVAVADVADGSRPLPVRGESRTGRPAPALEPGTACRIFTGAPIPAGADAVVMQENVERDGDRARVLSPVSRGDHVRRAGEDLGAGVVALPSGTRLGPYQLGLAAAVDRGQLLVARRPRVTILCTGDELRKPGTEGRPASIPESNGIVVRALAESAGAEATVAGAASDDLAATRKAIAAALASSDVVVTIGGVSVGDHDVVRPALEAEGVALDFYKVAMKPGKPLTLGRRGEVLVLGLPGNPMSAQVTFALFGLPVLRALQGDVRAAPVPRLLRLTAPLRQKPGRRGFYPAAVSGDSTTPLAGQSSGSTVSLARADGLIVVPEDSGGYATGEACDVLLLGDL